MTERRWGILTVIALGAFVAFMILVGSIGPARPEVDPLSVVEARAGGEPADRWGGDELHVTGWYAELDADCAGDDGGADEVTCLRQDLLEILVADLGCRHRGTFLSCEWAHGPADHI